MARLNQVTIVGLGLMGGSLGMALRRRKLCRAVVGLSRHRRTIDQARRRGAIDWGSTEAEAAVQNADLVVVASPVEQIVPQVRRVSAFMRPGSLITDVGSTKQRIVEELHRLPGGVGFVGSHPLAGSERQGIDAAHTELFDGSTCIVTPERRTPAAMRQRVVAFWKPLVGRVVVMDATKHDAILAAVSHLPHALAYCLMQATDRSASAFAPKSFLDATRIAKSDPDLWDDILLSNRGPMLKSMDRFGQAFRQCRTMLDRVDRRGLRAFMAQAQQHRMRLDG